MSRTRILTAAAGVALVALALTGCATHGSTHTDAKPAVTSAPSTAPAPTKTEASKPEVTPGAIVTADTTLPDGYVAYPMANGSKVAVSENAPVPAPVLTDAGKQAAAKVQLSGTSESAHEAVETSANGRASLVSVQTEHSVVLVYRGLGDAGTVPPFSMSPAWKVAGSVSGFPALVAGNGAGWPTAAAAAAAANAAIAGHPDFVVVVAE
ncbi:hypothetical protein GCM10022288_15870 [Gryllotalpicola kribbensis]|uniref:Lipoprotein n=1 Tax=Gryllotalpicola kribbensis TaxID=993084 RepID=A0ABP8AS73_9MICO